MFELCILTVHTLMCTGDAGPEQSLVMLKKGGYNKLFKEKTGDLPLGYKE